MRPLSLPGASRPPSFFRASSRSSLRTCGSGSASGSYFQDHCHDRGTFVLPDGLCGARRSRGGVAVSPDSSCSCGSMASASVEKAYASISSARGKLAFIPLSRWICTCRTLPSSPVDQASRAEGTGPIRIDVPPCAGQTSLRGMVPLASQLPSRRFATPIQGDLCIVLGIVHHGGHCAALR